MQQKTAIIIGAGPAGLTAAYTLLKETDLHPVILEESEFIGGISRTAVYRNNRMDIGGHRFFSKSDAVTALWNELMPVQGAPAKDDILLGRQKPLVAGGPDPEKEDRVMLVRDRVSRIFYLGKFFHFDKRNLDSLTGCHMYIAAAVFFCYFRHFFDIFCCQVTTDHGQSQGTITFLFLSHITALF